MKRTISEDLSTEAETRRKRLCSLASRSSTVSSDDAVIDRNTAARYADLGIPRPSRHSKITQDSPVVFESKSRSADDEALLGEMDHMPPILEAHPRPERMPFAPLSFVTGDRLGVNSSSRIQSRRMRIESAVQNLPQLASSAPRHRGSDGARKFEESLDEILERMQSTSRGRSPVYNQAGHYAPDREEDEKIEAVGRTFVLPAKSRARGLETKNYSPREGVWYDESMGRIRPLDLSRFEGIIEGITERPGDTTLDISKPRFARNVKHRINKTDFEGYYQKEDDASSQAMMMNNPGMNQHNPYLIAKMGAQQVLAQQRYPARLHIVYQNITQELAIEPQQAVTKQQYMVAMQNGGMNTNMNGQGTTTMPQQQQLPGEIKPRYGARKALKPSPMMIPEAAQPGQNQRLSQIRSDKGSRAGPQEWEWLTKSL